MPNRPHTTRGLIAWLVLTLGLPAAGLMHCLLFIQWASPGPIVDYDVRPYPASTQQGQLVYYWCLIGGWLVVWLSGFLLVGRWSERLRRPLTALVTATPLLLAATMLIASIWVMSASQLRITPMASVQGLGRKVGMQFPPGTQLIEARALHTLDWVVAAKLRMPKACVIPFIKGPFFARLRDSYGHPELSVSRSDVSDLMDWAQPLGMSEWHPERLRSFVSAEVDAAGSQHLSCLVADMTESQMSTVYFVFAVY
jgi:hypothetical protein